MCSCRRCAIPTSRSGEKTTTESGDFRVFNWQEMKLDEYLYSNGEVVKLWLYPRGPDSGFVAYPGQGSRWGYFDTTPLSHALGEPCYIVEPHPPGTKLRSQWSAGFLAQLRERRRQPSRAGQRLATVFHRSGRRPVLDQDQGRAWPARSRLPLHADASAIGARTSRSRSTAPT